MRVREVQILKLLEVVTDKLHYCLPEELHSVLLRLQSLSHATLLVVFYSSVIDLFVIATLHLAS
jgi:hypothetical protein